jgi:GAF domain-containing protein
MLADVSEADDGLAGVLAEVTAHLVRPDPDPGTVLRLVTDGCVRVLGVAAAGVMVVDPRSGLAVAVATDERSRFVELLQSQVEQGPCVDCIRGATVVNSPDLMADHHRWPRFVGAAADAGYRAVHAFPLLLDDRAVGGLNLLDTSAGSLSTARRRTGQVLADLAVLGLSVERQLPRRAKRLAEHTLAVLNDRVAWGQAIGLLAGALDIDPSMAWTLLRRHARRGVRPIREVVAAITDGTLRPDELAGEVGQSQSGSSPG